jgi:hypothetical protein
VPFLLRLPRAGLPRASYLRRERDIPLTAAGEALQKEKRYLHPFTSSAHSRFTAYYLAFPSNPPHIRARTALHVFRLAEVFRHLYTNYNN